MKHQRSWVDTLLQGMELQEESVPGHSIVELCGDHRVLIENHFGVLEYSLERICVRVRFGKILVEGSDLRMRKMQGKILVICGAIHRISLIRGCGS